MKKIVLLLILLTIPWPAHARTEAEQDLSKFFAGRQATFVLLDVKRNKYVRYNKEVAAERLSPCSTFKIPNSLFGLEAGVIADAEHVIKWDGQRRTIEAWNQDLTLRAALKESAVWYYLELARKVGEARLSEYVRAISYGNADTSGGIAQPFWIEGSLKISADEQIEFLRRLHERQLPFSKRSTDIVLDIMKLSEKDGVIFRGKTGTAGDLKKNIATLGWFVGSVERDGQFYIFATNIRSGENPSGRTARKITEEVLKSMQLM